MSRNISSPAKILISILVGFFSCVHVHAQDASKPESSPTDTVVFRKSGHASYYNDKFQGKKTSSGERLDNTRYTAAHPSLPFGTLIRVTNKRNGKSTIVKVNDRFWPKGEHLVDITKAAAKDIDMIRDGIARITLEVLNPVFAEALMPADTITYRLSSGKQVFPTPELSRNGLPDMLPMP
jgi:rare lipoprotein A